MWRGLVAVINPMHAECGCRPARRLKRSPGAKLTRESAARAQAAPNEDAPGGAGRINKTVSRPLAYTIVGGMAANITAIATAVKTCHNP